MALRVKRFRPCAHVGMSQKVNHEQDKGRRGHLAFVALPISRRRMPRAAELSCLSFSLRVFASCYIVAFHSTEAIWRGKT